MNFKNIIPDFLKDVISEDQINKMNDKWKDLQETSKAKGESVHEVLEDLLKPLVTLKTKFDTETNKESSTKQPLDFLKDLGSKSTSIKTSFMDELDKIFNQDTDEPTCNEPVGTDKDVESGIFVVTANDILNHSEEFVKEFTEILKSKKDFIIDIESLDNGSGDNIKKLFDIINDFDYKQTDLENDNVTESGDDNMFKKQEEYYVEPEKPVGCHVNNTTDQFNGMFTDKNKQFLDDIYNPTRDNSGYHDLYNDFSNLKVGNTTRPAFLTKSNTTKPNVYFDAIVIKYDQKTSIIGIPLLGYSKNELVIEKEQNVGNRGIKHLIKYPNNTYCEFNVSTLKQQDVSKTVVYDGILYLTFVEMKPVTEITL